MVGSPALSRLCASETSGRFITVLGASVLSLKALLSAPWLTVCGLAVTSVLPLDLARGRFRFPAPIHRLSSKWFGRALNLDVS